MLLRDIIDLEATYAGPEAKAPKADENGGAPVVEVLNGGNGEIEPPIPTEADLDDDDLENNVSLSAMEAELKPRVLETFDRIADNYKKLRRLQVEHVDQRLQNKQLTPAQERKHKKLKEDVVTDVKSLSLNANRIEALVEQLYACRSSGAEAGASSSRTARTRSTSFATTSTTSPPRRAWRSRSSARSSPWSRRASGKRARPRRR